MEEKVSDFSKNNGSIESSKIDPKSLFAGKQVKAYLTNGVTLVGKILKSDGDYIVLETTVNGTSRKGQINLREVISIVEG